MKNIYCSLLHLYIMNNTNVNNDNYLKKFPIDIFTIIMDYYNDIEYNKLIRLKDGLNRYKEIQIWRDDYTKMSNTQKFIIDNIFKFKDNYLKLEIRLGDSDLERSNNFFLEKLSITNLKNINRFFKLLFLIHGYNINVDDVYKNDRKMIINIHLINTNHDVTSILYSQFRNEIVKNRISQYNILDNIFYLEENEYSLINIRNTFTTIYELFGVPTTDMLKNLLL